MEWLTKEEIKKAAEKSTQDAIRMSIRHWEQIRDCTPKELRDAWGYKMIDSSSDFCALCYRFGDSLHCDKECPLMKEAMEENEEVFGLGCEANVSIWKPASRVFYAKIRREEDDTEIFDQLINVLKKYLEE